MLFKDFNTSGQFPEEYNDLVSVSLGKLSNMSEEERSKIELDRSGKKKMFIDSIIYFNEKSCVSDYCMCYPIANAVIKLGIF